jgi:putative cardiolipin synthase
MNIVKAVSILILLVSFPLIGKEGSSNGEYWLDQYCVECTKMMQKKTGSFILEKGEEALMARAWLTNKAQESIDVQYFIWSTDNIGTLASEALLSAAERGVKIRVLVDDFLVDAEDLTILSLTAHPNVDIRIYNPKHSVGVSSFGKFINLIRSFRSSNQRMHDKVAMFDGKIGITGGRNMADEYYDFDHDYNFRDRDILVLGKVVEKMSDNFEEFWNSDLSIPVEELLQDSMSELDKDSILKYTKFLHEYALDESNFSPDIRYSLNNLPSKFSELVENLIWEDVEFISDIPGKNENTFRLSGGSESYSDLVNEVSKAEVSVTIQSPYVILPDEGIELLSDLVARGVVVQISTNSLASTDNLMAFSGYHRQRDALIKAGVEIYEFKSNAKIQQELMERYTQLAKPNLIFALHAKSMVIDKKRLFIGSFNLDPRSANLNTEVGVLITNETLAGQLYASIQNDMELENSWKVEADFSPGDDVSISRQIKLAFYKLIPMNSLL